MILLKLYKKFKFIPFSVIIVLVLAVGIHSMDVSKKREADHFVKNQKNHIRTLSSVTRALEEMALDDLTYLADTNLFRNGPLHEKETFLAHYMSKYHYQMSRLFLMEGERVLIRLGEPGMPETIDTAVTLPPDFIELTLNGKKTPARQITIPRGEDVPLRLIAVFTPERMIRHIFAHSALPPELKYWAAGPGRTPRVFVGNSLFAMGLPDLKNLLLKAENHAVIPAASRAPGPFENSPDLLVVFSPLSVFGGNYCIGVAITEKELFRDTFKTNLVIGITALVIISGITALFFTVLEKEKGTARIEADLRRRVEERNLSLKKEIQERKETQHKLRQAKEAAEAASTTKSRFLANMSHEIRTPLNGIIGMTEILKGECRDADQREYISVIHAEASALLGLINDFLDISKIEAEGLDLEEARFDLKKLVRDISKGIAIHASKKGLVFQHRIQPEIPDSVRGDAVKIRQILANLTGNALKFTHHGGITLRALMVENPGKKIKIRFEIEDTGIGIPKNLQEKIFESFTQADSSTTRKYGGTGLGTTIARKLAEKMGGDIGVESNGESGSLFWFTALFEPCSPLDRPSIAPLPGDHPPAARPSPARILVAEDYAANQRVILKHLHDAGYQAELVENGRDALSAFETGNYDLVLMDVQMPEMDGYRATTEIRRLEAKRRGHAASRKRTPVIAMTANAFSKDMERCHQAGMDDYIAKPFKKRAFLQIILKWLSKEPPKKGTPRPTEEMRESTSPMDFPLALNEFGNNRPFLLEVITEFIGTVRKQIEKIAATPPPERFETACKEAHAIKGGASNLFAGQITALAKELEHSGKNKTDEQITTLLPRLERELTQLERYLDTLR